MSKHPWRRATRGQANILFPALVFLGMWSGGLDAQESRTEWLGDLLMLSLPITSTSATFLLEDYVGTRDFLYGFGLNAVVTEGLKRALQRERPNGSDERSFPSGHTSISFQSASFIHFRYGWEYAVPAYAAASFVGYSRVYAGAHFVEDVVAGLALGVISSGIFTEQRPEESPGVSGELGMALHLRFGGGLGTSWGMGFAELGR